ncbi:Disease resistance protein [Corchorus capsularis]|uniref:Disease resistance protein n=1 Tax=Corchorus capsularis TaxID=210143 RepID=A0A1R3JWC5_COCAP|nr:Disease resistance protein [Corchorus capsularis]
MSVTFFVDDIWKEIDWKTIGIPVGSAHHEGCKVLLTTRSEEVCIRMNCQEKIKLSILSEDEAWDLFKDKADLKDYASLQPGIIDVAKEVARECKGLPLAIVIVGKSLKIYKSPGEWRAALERLKDSTHLDDGDDFEEIYSCLQLSYDFLKVKNIQSCFLLCSLFPEDADIDVEELIICGIGQGLYSNIYSIDDKRREIRVALTKLQKCGLLMESHRIDQSCVRMHDVVRDFAHWITLRGGNKFLVEDGLAELVSASPMIESFRVCTVIALWNTKIKSLPDKLEFSELKILILEEEAKGEISVLVPHKINKEDNSLSIPSTFFERMNALQVLLLRNVTFSLDALQFLPHLRALRLSSCKLINNISSLGGHEKMLNKLEILLLADTVIEELPEGLVELCTSLKSLLLRGRGYCNISPNLLSRLSSLEEIFVPVRNNVNLLELNSLSHVTALTLSIYTTNNVECFEESFVFPKLQRYSIFVNENVNCWSSYSRMLEIRDFSYSLRAFKELCCNMEVLVLNNVEKLRSLEDLVDTTPTPNGFLQELKELRIEKCRRLRWVYQVNEKRHDETRLIFPQLQRLHISECDGLEQVFDFAKETPFWLEVFLGGF